MSSDLVISSASRPIEQEADLFKLPREMFTEVFSQSSAIPRSLFGRTCSQLQALFSHDMTWRRLYERDFKTVKKPDGIPYSQAYRRAHLILSNIVHGVYAHSTMCPSVYCESDYFPLIQVVDGRLITGGCGNSIMMMDLQTGQELATFDELGPVDVLLLRGGELITADARERAINIYDFASGKISRTFCLPAEAKTMIVVEQKLVIGHSHGLISLMDVNTGKTLQPLEGHQNPVVSLAFVDGCLFSGTDKNEFKIWDLDKNEYLFDFTLDQRPTSLAIVGTRLALGFESGNICVITKDNRDVRPTEMGHTGEVVSLAQAQIGEIQMLISASKDRTVKFWDLESGECVQTLNADIPCQVFFSDGKLFCLRRDFILQSWDFGADDTAILENIAEDIVVGDSRLAKQLFDQMPRSAQRKIHEMLFSSIPIPEGEGYLEDFKRNYPTLECVWHAYATSAEKAWAIEAYLDEQRLPGA